MLPRKSKFHGAQFEGLATVVEQNLTPVRALFRDPKSAILMWWPPSRVLPHWPLGGNITFHSRFSKIIEVLVMVCGGN